jgi:hypothetical protein
VTCAGAPCYHRILWPQQLLRQRIQYQVHGEFLGPIQIPSGSDVFDMKTVFERRLVVQVKAPKRQDAFGPVTALWRQRTHLDQLILGCDWIVPPNALIDLLGKPVHQRETTRVLGRPRAASLAIVALWCRTLARTLRATRIQCWRVVRMANASVQPTREIQLHHFEVLL